MEQLKPCPFCGSTNVVAMHNSERDEQIVPGTDVKLNTWMVECQECLSGTGYEKTEQAAIGMGEYISILQRKETYGFVRI